MFALDKAQHALDAIIGLGVFAWFGGWIWYHALNRIVQCTMGTKYLFAYAYDYEGRKRAKKRADGTRVSPNVPVEP